MTEHNEMPPRYITLGESLPDGTSQMRMWFLDAEDHALVGLSLGEPDVVTLLTSENIDGATAGIGSFVTVNKGE